MQNKKLAISAVLAIVAVTTLLAGPRAFAQHEKVLHSFVGPGGPGGGLVLDKAGNLYGITTFGGTYAEGSVYQLSPAGNGWTERDLYSFNPNVGDGASPLGALVFDAAGNLYGTTSAGGTSSSGTVFELSPRGGGLWQERILHNFKPNPPDGKNPYAGLIFDSAGNLYGTTYFGGSGTGCGSSGCGTVFELSPKKVGTWATKIIYNFNGGTTDGQNPFARLAIDSAGNLYGTTQFGGAGGSFNSGSVFELSPNGSGGWTESLLHSFINDGADGYNPDANLILDSAGNLYSTTNAGGLNNFGTVFELSPAGVGTWTETIQHNFNYGGDGVYPEFSGLIFDTAGNLYGTLSSGGDGSIGTMGAVFEMTPAAGGGWTESIVFTFNGTDGNEPLSGIILDAKGNIFGTTQYGGANVAGTAFEIKR